MGVTLTYTDVSTWFPSTHRLCPLIQCAPVFFHKSGILISYPGVPSTAQTTVKHSTLLAATGLSKRGLMSGASETAADMAAHTVQPVPVDQEARLGIDSGDRVAENIVSTSAGRVVRGPSKARLTWRNFFELGAISSIPPSIQRLIVLQHSTMPSL